MTDNVSDWSRNLKNVPEISHKYIYKWAGKDEKVPKAKLLNGYSKMCYVVSSLKALGMETPLIGFSTKIWIYSAADQISLNSGSKYRSLYVMYLSHTPPHIPLPH